jgi:hypothetical protein
VSPRIHAIGDSSRIDISGSQSARFWHDGHYLPTWQIMNAGCTWNAAKRVNKPKSFEDPHIS